MQIEETQKDKAVVNDKKKNKMEEENKDQLSEEDQLLKDKIDLLVNLIMNASEDQAKSSLNELKTIVRTSTTSMTSVPKPLKFIKPHYEKLVKFYDQMKENNFKRQLADFLSVLSMTMSEQNSKLSLIFLMEGTQRDFVQWGHGYLQHLSGDIALKFKELTEAEEDDQQILDDQIGLEDLTGLVEKIVEYFTEHNAEHDAVDLLLEVDELERIKQYISDTNTSRFLQYLAQSALYSVDQESMLKTLEICYDVAIEKKNFGWALKFAIKLDNRDKIERVFNECTDNTVKLQLCFYLARQGISLESLDEEQKAIASNLKLTEFYNKLAKELDVAPKHPLTINEGYAKGAGYGTVNNAKLASGLQNLGDTFLNAFMNCGLRKDGLMVRDNNSETWIDQLNNEHKIAGIASIGLVELWDIEEGIQRVTDYLESKNDWIRMGAYIATGLFNIGINDENFTAYALFNEQIYSDKYYDRLGAIIGIGYACAGKQKESLLDELIPIMIEGDSSTETSSYASLSMGLAFCGTSNIEYQNTITDAIFEILKERSEEQLNPTVSRYFGVGLGLLYLGQQDKCAETVKKFWELGEKQALAKYIAVTIEGCAYIGSGNMLIIQKMLNMLKEPQKQPFTKVDEIFSYQAAAVLGIALIASSEDIGGEMVSRTLNHMLQYCEEPVIRRAVPLAMAVMNISNPKLNIIATLMKLANEADNEIAQRSIIALGLVGAGTNNSRLGDCLKQLANHFFSNKDKVKHQFLTRVSQGLLYMGQGLVTLQPYYSDRFLLSKNSMSGIIMFLHSALDTDGILCSMDKNHHFFNLAMAIQPKMLFLVDENLQDSKIHVRVGMAVDTTGMTGKPKSIQGFRTHTSPVVLNHGERAELGDDEYIPLIECDLESVIIIKKNPDWQPPEENKKTRKTSL